MNTLSITVGIYCCNIQFCHNNQFQFLPMSLYRQAKAFRLVLENLLRSRNFALQRISVNKRRIRQFPPTYISLDQIIRSGFIPVHSGISIIGIGFGNIDCRNRIVSVLGIRGGQIPHGFCILYTKCRYCRGRSLGRIYRSRRYFQRIHTFIRNRGSIYLSIPADLIGTVAHVCPLYFRRILQHRDTSTGGIHDARHYLGIPVLDAIFRHHGTKLESTPFTQAIRCRFVGTDKRRILFHKCKIGQGCIGEHNLEFGELYLNLHRIPDYIRVVRDVFGNFGIDRHVSFRREPSRFGTGPPETDSVRSRIYGPANRQRVERIATDESVRYPVETVVFLFPEIDLHFWQESIRKRIYLRYMESRRCSHHHMALVPGQKHLAVHGRKRAQLGEILEILPRRCRQGDHTVIMLSSFAILGIIPVRSLASIAKAERVVCHFQCIASGKSIPLKMVAVFLFIEPHGGLARGSIIRSSEVRIAPGLRDRFIEHTHASGILGIHTHHVTAIEQSRQMQGDIQRILADS